MEQLLLAAALVLVAVLVAWLLRRRGPDAPTRASWSVPAQLDPADFPRGAGADWLVVAFTSATCGTCAAVREDVERLTARHLATPPAGSAGSAGPADSVGSAGSADPTVALAIVELAEEPELHRRYGIDAVPTVVVADPDGVVAASVVGPLGPDDLEALGTLLTRRPDRAEGSGSADGTPVEFP